ncbi:MAG TPA: hypothetical protein VG347_04940 [Verrucomicrobiae bacterium]|nr:hypothetical protein [Verrucomicrobiae bacterium]
MPSPVVIWIWLCAYLNAAGWILSATHQLNKAGYLVVFIAGLAVWLTCQRQTGTLRFPKIHKARLKRRFSRAFPLMFLILAGLAFLGGALHDACNYDALAYRTPRVLHWLAAQQWVWIHTDFQRLNTRTAGFEWLTAPQFLFLHTDRFVFLANVLSFLLLPGRVFAVLTHLGVRARTAWYWMWLFPAGYGYVLQAGSVVNDMFGAVMALAAFEYALRAARRKNDADLWTSGLAMALMTAAKAFNIILLLPWVIAALPACRLLLRRPAISLVVIIFAAQASMLPTAYLNWHECHDWTGLKAEQATIGGGGKLLRFMANAVSLPLNNLAPPFFPFSNQWSALMNRIIPSDLHTRMVASMENGLASAQLPELQVEETAGLGMGLTLVLLVLLFKKAAARDVWPQQWLAVETCVPLAGWLTLGVFMMQVGSAGPARYLLPFYPLLAVPILRGAVADNFFRSPGWRKVALFLSGISLLLVVVCPARPLWPAMTILRSADAEHSSNRWLVRAWNVYGTYGTRADGFTKVIAALPADANPLGYMGADEPEGALWRPFGQRQIRHICYADTPASVRERGIKYALVSEYFLAQHPAMQPAEWVSRMDAEIIQVFDLKLLAGQDPRHWLLLRFN